MCHLRCTLSPPCQQKGVIKILSDHNIPYVNGNLAEIVICSSTVLKQGTVSQLLEAAYTQYAIDHMHVDSHITHRNAFLYYATRFNTPRCALTRVLTLYEADVVVNERTIARKVYRVGSNISDKCNVQKNYGSIRVM